MPKCHFFSHKHSTGSSLHFHPSTASVRADCRQKTNT